MILLLFIFGLIVGSFLNVLIYRWNVEGSPSPFRGRSFCPNCKKVIVWQDLIPVVSFLRLRGRCRFCRAPISRQYPLVEVVTVVSFSLVGLNWLNLALVGLLIVIFFSDWRYGLIPDQAVVGIGLIGLISQIGQIWPNLAAGLVVASAFALLIVLSKGRGMGWGDVKLVLVMGILLGTANLLLAVWMAFVLGGSSALLLLLLKRKKMRDTIALGPFLVIGILVAYFYGSQILPAFGL